MPSKAKAAFDANGKDIAELWRINREAATESRSEKYGVEVLNRAVVVFVTACWESYIEDLAIEAFDHLLAKANVASAIPMKVRTLATAQIWEQKDPTKVWEIADEGWRVLLLKHKAAILDRWLGSFNTPKTAQVNTLYSELLGISHLSATWSWEGFSAENAAAKLDLFIRIRGDIAHRFKPKTGVSKHVGTNYLEHVRSIVECCERSVQQHLVATTGESAW